MDRVGKKMLYDFAEENNVEGIVIIWKRVLFYIELLVRVFYDLARLMNSHLLFRFALRFAEEVCKMKFGVAEF